MSARSVRIRVGGQNLTESPGTPALRDCDALVLQETPSLDRLKDYYGDGWRFLYEPAGHQAIGWRQDVFQVTGEGKAHRFHGSGQGDERIPDAIRTPARFLLEQPLRHESTGIDLDVFGTWLLNSWRPMRRDRFTEMRERIVLERELPVVQRQFEACRQAGRLGIAEADWNTLRGHIAFPGWQVKPRYGLDRFAWTQDRRLRFLGIAESAATGVGPQRHHKGKIATFELRRVTR